MTLVGEIDRVLAQLVTSIDVSEPAERQIPGRSTSPPNTTAAYVVTISAKNDAPPNPDGPQVVFVGLTFVIRGGDRNGELHQRWAREASLARSGGPPPPPIVVPGPQPKGGERYPAPPPSQKTLGEYLFPGQAVSCSWIIPIGDLSGLSFDVDATVSRRHLFHGRPPLTP